MAPETPLVTKDTVLLQTLTKPKRKAKLEMKGMTKAEGKEYQESKRQASFTQKKLKRFREWLDFARFIEYKPNDDVVDVLGHLAQESVILIIAEAKLLQSAWSAAAAASKKAAKEAGGVGVDINGGGGRGGGESGGPVGGGASSEHGAAARAGGTMPAIQLLERDKEDNYIGEQAVLEVSRRHERASEPLSMFRGGRVAPPQNSRTWLLGSSFNN